MKYTAKEKFAESIASGQSNQLDIVLSDKVSNNEQLSTELKDMIRIHNRSNNIGK